MKKSTLLIVLLGFLFAANSVSADGGMMGYGDGYDFSDFGGMGIFHGLWMLIFWGLVIAGVIFLAKSFGKNSNTNSDETALDILEKRLAKGEINKKEFQALKKELEK